MWFAARGESLRFKFVESDIMGPELGDHCVVGDRDGWTSAAVLVVRIHLAVRLGLL